MANLIFYHQLNVNEYDEEKDKDNQEEVDTDDEAEEVRELLTQNEIPFFETFAGNWRISMPGLWLVNEQQFDEARSLLDEYQEIRSTRVKSQYLKQREQGEIRTFWKSFRAEPVRFSVYLGLAALVLFLSLRFFVSF